MPQAGKADENNQQLSDYDFTLPSELIAQHPAAQRSHSRLLHVLAGSGGGAMSSLHDGDFTLLPDLLQAGDLLVLNDTRVIQARFLGSKQSGGKIEVLLERIVSTRLAWAQIRASKTPAPATLLWLESAFSVRVGQRVGTDGALFQLLLGEEETRNFWQLAEEYGRMPLPPYISHPPTDYDKERYQTIYASQPGAVAAPTAGLHFDEGIFQRLQSKGVRLAYLTLHVGAGTFQPIRVEDISQHHMHSERYCLPAVTANAVNKALQAGRRVIAVGTTSLRALEAAASASNDGLLREDERETSLFIRPGYRFKVVDALLTNFHLPRSTLLILVSAFAGVKTIREAYAYAIASKYRFFSYGDAMFLERQAKPGS